jgi:multiple antibiotic resistance protein
VTTGALRIAGGLVVASRAWELLSAPQHHEDRKQEQAATASGADDVAFFPLTMPFTAGPGAISVAIALSASRPTSTIELLPFFAGSSMAAAAVAVTVGFCYASADRVVKLLGPAGARVVTRLTAFLLLCIGVQIVLTGIQDALPPLLAGHE